MRPIEVLWIRVDGPMELKSIDGDSLSDMHELVHGYIEVVPVWIAKDHKMVANEEGLLRKMKYNVRASVLVQDTIVGDVFIARIVPGEDGQEFGSVDRQFAVAAMATMESQAGTPADG